MIASNHANVGKFGVRWPRSVHQAVAFAIASEFGRKPPFARNLHSEDDIFAISFANHSQELANFFATVNSQLFV